MSRPERIGHPLLLGLLALLAAGCGAQVAPPALQQAFLHLPELSSAAIAFEPIGQTRAPLVTSVTASVTLNRARGVHQVWADFHAPDGTSFQRSATVVEEVWAETPLTFSLPVSGTVIDSSALVGTWSVQYLVDGVALTSLSFDLEP